MNVTLHPSNIQGNIQTAASKSSMQRACAAALLHKGKSILLNPGKSNDDLAALDVITTLGATIRHLKDGSIEITSHGMEPVNGEMNCGESGLGIRMFTPLAALSPKQITINGSGSLLTRPMHFFDEIFPQLEISITSNDGKLPLQIQGPLTPKDITIDGSLSSQFLTGLLMAYSKAISQQETRNQKPETRISVSNLKSKPYIDLTLQVMKDFGMHVPENDNYEQFIFKNVQKENNQTITYTVEGDWSGAAFLLVAGAIAGKINVSGLQLNSTQADKAILQALQSAGALLSITDNNIEIGPAPLQPFHFDATDCPDLFPPLVALAAYCAGMTSITGVSRLAHKESDRGITLQQEFEKMGIEIILQDDLMIIKGGTPINASKVHSRHDHRIAMACAVAGLKANGPIEIEEAYAINKSYPEFYKHLQQLGAMVID